MSDDNLLLTNKQLQRQRVRKIGVLVLVIPSVLFGHQSPNTQQTPAMSSSQGNALAVRAAVTAVDQLPTATSFDTIQGRFNPVRVNVEVREPRQRLDSAAPRPVEISGEEVISAAGSYGDFLRYLQVLPGVVPTSDTSNEALVRGGHPMENLYLVEGFEIPNINHLSRPDSTGGFAPMIDSALVQRLTLHTGGNGPEFSDRLSSVTEIDLLDTRDARGHFEGDLGIQGIGGLLQTKVHSEDLLVSGHHGLLDAVTRDAGMSGVPSYSNELSRLEISRPAGDRLTILNVAGWDSISITPCQSDWEESSEIKSQYSGWRTTTGVSWQRPYSTRSFGVLSVTDSELVQHIHQQDQFLDPSRARITKRICPLPKNYVSTTPVYIEDTHSGSTSTSFKYEWATSSLSLSAGSTGWLQRPNFNIEQPVGAYSPFSATVGRGDSTSIASNFITGETGSFVNATYRWTKNLSIGGGSRLQTFALGNHLTFTSRVSVRYRIREALSVNGAFGTYAQLPPYIYLLSFARNRSLAPMRAQHRIVGLDFEALPRSLVRIEAYSKPYTHIPAASEYPAVTLHSMPSQLGDEIVWLPMNSRGFGRAEGVEISDTSRFGSRAIIRGSLAYARARFAGDDGILRPSNFDLPWIANALSTVQIGKGFGASARYGFATGRPYTPYDMAASVQRNRPIYDLAHLNTRRAPSYSRLDVQMNKDFALRGRHLQIYAGVDNVTNHQNFLTYAWLPLAQYHRDSNKNPVRELSQMPIFPNFGLRFVVR